MTTPQTSAPDYTQAHDTLADSLAYIGELIRDLARDLPLVHALLDTHTRGLGFLTHDGRLAMDELTRKERQIRRDNQRLGFPEPSGNTTAPAAMSALQVMAEASFALQRLAHRGHTILERNGICPIVGGLPDTAPIDELLLHLAQLLEATPSRHLHDDACRELEHLVEITKRVVDGNDRTLLPAPCPHCELRTLVVYHDEGIVRCDRDPKTGHYAPCVCPDSYCDCHQKPVTHRHTWHRSNPAASNSWWALGDRLNLNRTINKETTHS